MWEGHSEVGFASLIGWDIVLATARAAFLRAYGVSRKEKFKPKLGGTHRAVFQLYNILDPHWPIGCEEKPKGWSRLRNIFSTVHIFLRNSLALWPELSLGFLLQGQTRTLYYLVYFFKQPYISIYRDRACRFFVSFYRMFLFLFFSHASCLKVWAAWPRTTCPRDA